MKSDFCRLYEVMINSETIADGEYYVIHADHIHDFKMAIKHYFEESNGKIELLDIKSSMSGVEIVLEDKINEIIRNLNEED